MDIQIKVYFCGPYDAEQCEIFNIALRPYDIRELCALLREHKNNPDAIEYIADKMEE